MKRVEVDESMEDDMIPDEFSMGEGDEEPAYEAVEEKFEPRESISSRGGGARNVQERYSRYNRTTNIALHGGDKHEENRYSNFKNGEESFDPVNRSSSVIEEIENQVVYLDSDKDEVELNEMGKLESNDKSDRDKQIQEYLDIDKNAYVNKAEYEEDPQNEDIDAEIR